MWKRIRIPFLVHSEQETNTQMRSSQLGRIAQVGGQLKLLLESLQRDFVVAFIPVGSSEREQRDGSFLAIPGRLIELQRFSKQRYCFIKIALLKLQSAQGQLGPGFGSTDSISLRKIERLFEVLTGLIEFAPRDKSITEVDQTVCCQVSDVVHLRHMDSFNRDLFGTLSIAFNVVNTTQLQLRLYKLVLVVGAARYFQRLFQLCSCLGEFPDLAQQSAALVEDFG